MCSPVSLKLKKKNPETLELKQNPSSRFPSPGHEQVASIASLPVIRLCLFSSPHLWKLPYFPSTGGTPGSCELSTQHRPVTNHVNICVCKLWGARDDLSNSAFICLKLSTRKSVMTELLFVMAQNIELLYRLGRLVLFIVFYSIFSLFLTVTTGIRSVVWVCVHTCMFMCISVTSARELRSLWRSLFPKSFPVKPSHNKEQGVYYRRYYKVFGWGFAFASCKYMVLTRHV